MPRRRRLEPEDPWTVLGLPAGSPAAAVQRARRELAKREHPDIGGSAARMQRVNEAAARALAELAERAPDRGSTATSRSDVPSAPPWIRQDHPSFTVEVLPVEAYEGLLVVAAQLGDVVLDDPPYVLEVAMSRPLRGWCRLDVVPDAGASTVSISVAAVPGHPVPELDRVRDLWVDGLNGLDWTDPGSPRPS